MVVIQWWVVGGGGVRAVELFILSPESTLTISRIKQSDTNTEADANFGHKISAEAIGHKHRGGRKFRTQN
eukprot:scaffold188431_cov41-Cyclotella_meneghiniana.AAC.2